MFEAGGAVERGGLGARDAGDEEGQDDWDEHFMRQARKFRSTQVAERVANLAQLSLADLLMILPVAAGSKSLSVP